MAPPQGAPGLTEVNLSQKHLLCSFWKNVVLFTTDLLGMVTVLLPMSCPCMEGPQKGSVPRAHTPYIPFAPKSLKPTFCTKSHAEMYCNTPSLASDLGFLMLSVIYFDVKTEAVLRSIPHTSFLKKTSHSYYVFCHFFLWKVKESSLSYTRKAKQRFPGPKFLASHSWVRLQYLCVPLPLLPWVGCVTFEVTVPHLILLWRTEPAVTWWRKKCRSVCRKIQ
jgi:hypothetical protein